MLRKLQNGFEIERCFGVVTQKFLLLWLFENWNLQKIPFSHFELKLELFPPKDSLGDRRFKCCHERSYVNIFRLKLFEALLLKYQRLVIVQTFRHFGIQIVFDHRILNPFSHAPILVNQVVLEQGVISRKYPHDTEVLGVV